MYRTKYAERKPGLNKSQGCLRCITLYYTLISMYNQKYKKLSQTIKGGPVTGKTGSPMFSFLSYSIFWLIPIWGIEASGVYLFAQASKTHARGSPRRGTLRYSSGSLWPYVDGSSPLSQGFIGFLCKSRNTASFLL